MCRLFIYSFVLLQISVHLNFTKEISDSLQILLAIGTNSNDGRKEGEQSSDSSKNICSLQNLMGFTPEEVIKLQELFKLLASRTKHRHRIP